MGVGVGVGEGEGDGEGGGDGGGLGRNCYTEISVDHNLSRKVTVNKDECKLNVEKPTTNA